MMSFDVVSLFAAIPVDKACAYIKARLHGRFLLRYKVRFSPFEGCKRVDQL